MEPESGTTSQDLNELTQLLDEAGLYVAVELRGNAIQLSGEVESEDDHQAVLDLANGFAADRGFSVEDSIDVIEELPESSFTFFRDADEADESDTIDIARQEGVDPADVQRSIGTSDSMLSAEEAIPYFPPTDPVVEPTGGPEELEVVGGFGATSFDRREQAGPTANVNDEEITDLVRRELREDATTTDFDIEVETRAGVVFLRGAVETLDDAENVEAVASRVPGVLDVREELDVISLMNPPID